MYIAWKRRTSYKQEVNELEQMNLDTVAKTLGFRKENI